MTNTKEGITDIAARKLVLQYLPRSVEKILKGVEYENQWGHGAHIYDFEVYDAIIKLWEERIVDINFTSKGHPVIVYSNWRTVCPLRR